MRVGSSEKLLLGVAYNVVLDPEQAVDGHLFLDAVGGHAAAGHVQGVDPGAMVDGREFQHDRLVRHLRGGPPDDLVAPGQQGAGLFQRAVATVAQPRARPARP